MPLTAPPPARVALPRLPRPRLDTAAARYRLYALVAVALYAVALGSLAVKRTTNFVVSDGRGYYVYLPSLVVDGDLDFENQVREHWDGDPPAPLWEPRTPRGLVPNKYPVGVALTLAPSFLTAHAVAGGLHALTGAAWCAPDGYTLPYQLLTMAFIFGLGAASLALADRLATRTFGVPPGPAAAAVVAFWLGSHYLYYFVREPFMAHVVGCFWVTAAVALVASLRRGLPAGRLPAGRLTLLVFVTSMAVVCRPTSAAILLPFGLYLLVRVARAGLAGRLLARAPVAALGLAPVFVQMLVWHRLYGQWVVYSYAGEGFHWTRPAAWQTLFSSRHGLFFWSPLLLVAAVGLAARLRRDGRRADPLLGCFLAGFALLWYCNSCWHCWWFGDAFGGRAFLELGGLFVLGLAFAFAEAGRRARLPCAAAVAASGVYSLALMAAYVLHVVPRGDYLF
jgi:hypothetical protein